MPDSQSVILITGASSGIGAAVARLFAQEGFRVALAARRLERLQSLAQEIQASGGQALPVAADVSSWEEMSSLVSTTLECFGQIDVLFNNAGFGRLKWLEELDPQADIEPQLCVNLLGEILLARAVLPHMIARRRGHIINMASVAGLVATPTYTVYAATKFGVRGFTEALRREVGVYGIHVSAVYPGGVRTEFDEHAGIQRKTKKTTPPALRLEPEDVARGVLGLVRRPRRALILPWPMKFAVWMNDLFPSLMDWLVETNFVRPERGV